MLTKKSKYALKAILFLAKDEENKLHLISEIAEKENIPHKFLEAILLELKNSGMLLSLRGKNGGYKLAIPDYEISVGNIIRLIDGPLAPIPCVSRLFYQKCEECLDETTCEIRGVMKQVRDSIVNILDKTSLKDLRSGNYVFTEFKEL